MLELYVLCLHTYQSSHYRPEGFALVTKSKSPPSDHRESLCTKPHPRLAMSTGPSSSKLELPALIAREIGPRGVGKTIVGGFDDSLKPRSFWTARVYSAEGDW